MVRYEWETRKTRRDIIETPFQHNDTSVIYQAADWFNKERPKKRESQNRFRKQWKLVYIFSCMAVRRQVGKEHNNIIMGFRAVRGVACVGGILASVVKWWWSGVFGFSYSLTWEYFCSVTAVFCLTVVCLSKLLFCDYYFGHEKKQARFVTTIKRWHDQRYLAVCFHDSFCVFDSNF